MTTGFVGDVAKCRCVIFMIGGSDDAVCDDEFWVFAVVAREDDSEPGSPVFLQ